MVMEVESPEELGYDAIRCNLAESSLPDVPLKELGIDLDGVTLRYDDHRGRAELRELLAADAQGLDASHALVTGGAAMALFIVATTLLGPDDHIVVARPNYASNLETPRAIGCGIAYLDLRFEDGWRVDPERVAAAITPSTRLISLTSPHNPTGTTIDAEALHEVSAIAGRAGARLLLDETYREMSFGDPAPPAASIGPHVVAVGSLSKAYGMPGIRTGWILCSDTQLMETFLAAKEQVCLTGSVVDEEIALRVLQARDRWLPACRAKILESFGVTRAWMGTRADMEWVEPTGGAVCFPRMRPEARIDTDRFYRTLRDQFGTMVGPGHWFEQPPSYMRIGFGWPQAQELADGLDAVGRALDASAG
jgi:aspartate/methionine/tyrosine aminotransferase